MASITIRKLEDGLKAKLRVHAARQGRSMEDAAREILRAALSDRPRGAANLAEAIRLRFAGIGGVELELPERDATREPPRFSR